MPDLAIGPCAGEPLVEQRFEFSSVVISIVTALEATHYLNRWARSGW
jgi:hypothetical protein